MSGRHSSAVSDAEKAIAERYSKVLGSSVNPVLREGNSDRRVAGPVKKFAQKNPHPMPMSKYDAAGNKVGAMPWTADSKTRVAGMTDGDFFGSELSQRCAEKCEVRIEHVSAGGDVTVLKPSVKLQAGEVIDASRLSAAKREVSSKDPFLLLGNTNKSNEARRWWAAHEEVRVKMEVVREMLRDAPRLVVGPVHHIPLDQRFH